MALGYFSKFPFIQDYVVQGKTYTGQDMTRRTGLNPAIQNENESIYQFYMIQNGETAIMLADRAYDDPSKYWVILIFNNIIDPVAEWPLDQYSLEQFIQKKYENPNDVHHYTSNSTGAIVDINHPYYDRIPVTNYEYEINENDAKRKVKVPLPQYAAQIVQQHQLLITL